MQYVSISKFRILKVV